MITISVLFLINYLRVLTTPDTPAISAGTWERVIAPSGLSLVNGSFAEFTVIDSHLLLKKKL